MGNKKSRLVENTKPLENGEKENIDQEKYRLELRKKLGKEKLVEEVKLTPITLKFTPFSENPFDFSVSQSENVSLEEDSKYCVLPTNVIHEILLYLHPNELVNAFRTCRLFYTISSTNFFWKKYYLHFYDEHDGTGTTDEEKNIHYVVNWKKSFFKRYMFLTDCHYKKKYNVHKILEKKNEVDMKEVGFIIFGHNERQKHQFLGEISSELFQIRNNQHNNYVEREGRISQIIRTSIDYSNITPEEEEESINIFHVSLYCRAEKKSQFDFFYPQAFVDGIFITFDLGERQSFNSAKKLINEKKKEFGEDKFTLFLLVGLISSRNNNDNNECDNDELLPTSSSSDYFSREVEYEEVVKYSKSEELLGYVECLVNNNNNNKEEEEEEKRIINNRGHSNKNTNSLVCFGVMMDGVIRRRRKKKKTTGYEDLVRGDRFMASLMFRNNEKICTYH